MLSSSSHTSTASASWEYLMPKHIRIAGYIRESDEGLANSPTIESQAQAVRFTP